MKAGLDEKSFLLGVLAGALMVLSLGIAVAMLFFLKGARGVPADRANGVAPVPVTAIASETPKLPVEGTWFNVKYPDRPCTILSAPKGLLVTDQNGAVSRLAYDPAGFVIATDWRGGLHGELETNTIRWAHGGVWVRTPKEKQP